MIRQAKQEDVKKILEYLRSSVADCIYMYIDIGKYGLEHPAMKVWVDYDDADNVVLAIMKYHTGISFFTKEDSFDVQGVADIIKENNAMSVTARRDLVEKVYEILGADYEVEYGYVFEFNKYQDIECDAKIERATEEDMMECAKLVSTDEGIGSYYDISNLAEQYIERMRTDMGRNYIIREDGKIVAHIASYAEFDHIATTSGLIVDPEYRQKMYGAYIERYLVLDLIKDGFEVYTFITNRLRYRLLQAMGNKCLSEYGKLMINGNE